MTALGWTITILALGLITMCILIGLLALSAGGLL